ncbi:MAG: hypothetical protein J6Y01_06065, partial [Spirochaetales bacterium]|nr:hypothetical protein [Spirochaetales bacterium]
MLVRSLSDKGILRIVRHNQYAAVTFCRAEYGEMLRDNLTDDEKRMLHSRIAEAYVAAYPHNLSKFYEKRAYHYQCADILDKAVYY